MPAPSPPTARRWRSPRNRRPLLTGRGSPPWGSSPPQAVADAECPKDLDCRYIPAAYAQNDPANKSDYGNYDIANRPADLKIRYIVMHDTEVLYDPTIALFQNSHAYVSAHYVIRSSDGQVT